MTGAAELATLEGEIIERRRCPRLVAWREEVARTKRAAFADEEYWGRPVPGFGDPAARVVVLGLAPAAHGDNRTGPIPSETSASNTTSTTSPAITPARRRTAISAASVTP